MIYCNTFSEGTKRVSTNMENIIYTMQLKDSKSCTCILIKGFHKMPNCEKTKVYKRDL